MPASPLRDHAVLARTWLDALVVGLGSFALTFASLTLLGDRTLLPVWAPNALALAFLLRAPRTRWARIIAPAIAGDWLADIAVGNPLPAATVLALVTACECVGCAWALRARQPDEFELSTPPALIRFVAVAGLAAPLASALLARTALSFIGSAARVDLVMWTLGDALGLLMLTPAFLALQRLRALLVERPLTPRSMLSLAALMLVCALVFGQSHYRLLFAVMPALLWVSFELEMLGAALGVILVGGAAIVFTRQGDGPIANMSGGTAQRAIELQLFLAASVITAMTMATLHTQRRRLERAMMSALGEAQDQARRAKLAEEVAGVGYWRLDTVTGKLDWSDQMFRIFGVQSGSEPDFEAAMARVAPEERELGRRRLEHASRTGEGWSAATTRIIHPDGEVRLVTGRVVCEKDAEGRVVAFLGTLADITERQLAQASLAKSEQRYRLIAENVGDMILHADFNGQLDYVSPSAKALTGYEPEELIGRRWRELAHPEDRIAIRRKGVRARKAPSAYRPKWMEYRISRKDGRTVWVEACPSFVFDPETGRAVGITDVVRDITERKMLEGELTSALAEAEAAAAVKTEFLANMSHELRTPITAVVGFSKLLEEEQGLRPEAQRYVERVSGASKALLSTVNDILDFSRLEAGQVEIKRTACSPAAPAREAAELFAPQAAEKGITLSLEGLERLPETLAVDADRLRQMLLNLIGNAVKFTDAGVVRLQAGYDRANRRLSYAVVDTGPGVAPEHAARLFQRFSQVEASTSRKHGGAGLGLAICKGLAEAMGGEIGLDSEPGRGSRFWFWIPTDPGEAEAEAPAGQRPPALPPGCRVLVVDDNAANRDLARCLLEPFGAQVQEAVDGREGVALAQAEPFDVILMDVRMPEMDGPEAMRLIRGGCGPNRAAPILAFSADVGSIGGPDFVAAGFDGQIGKPLTALELISTVAAFAKRAPKPMRGRRALRRP